MEILRVPLKGIMNEFACMRSPMHMYTNVYCTCKCLLFNFDYFVLSNVGQKRIIQLELPSVTRHITQVLEKCPVPQILKVLIYNYNCSNFKTFV